MKKLTKKLIAGLVACATLIVSMPSPEMVWADEPAVVTEQAAENTEPGALQTDETVSQMPESEPQAEVTVPQVPEPTLQPEEPEIQTEEQAIQDEETKSQAEESEIEAEAAEPEDEEPEEISETHLETQTAGVTVKVEAEAGTFPEDVQLVAEVAGSDEEKEAAAAVDEVRAADTNVAASYTFDIKIVDTDGNELQPAEGKTVNIRFELGEAADANLTADVYHIEETDTESATDETDIALEAKKLESETNRDESSVTAVTDGFSLYTVEFTYNSLQYILPGGEKIALSAILEKLNLTGSVEAVEVSNEELFSAENESGEWFVTSHKAFSTTELMKVTIDGVVYEIVVTDESTTVSTWSALQDAITNASTGDTITLGQDITAESGDKAIAIIKDGFNLTIDLDGHIINRNLSSDNANNEGHVFDVNKGTVTIQNGTITGGSDEKGGGIVLNEGATLTTNNLNITNCRAKEDGGAIYIIGNGELEMTGGKISGNTAKSGGGGISIGSENGTATLTGVTIENNTASKWGGGGLNNKGTATLKGCTIQNNSAGNEGGGIYNGDRNLVLDNCTVTGNTASGSGGGGICCYGTVNISNSSSISNNTSIDGGGIYNYGSLTLDHVTVSGNESTKYGGAGINNKGTIAALTNCEITGNKAVASGAGIYSEGKITITDSTISNNETQSSGGGLRAYGCVASLTRCTMEDNKAADHGGAICDDNYDDNYDDSNTVSITGGCTISNNTADGGGSGIWVGSKGNLSIGGVNTINGNVVTDVYLASGRTITITDALEEGSNKSQIGIILQDQTGVFTSGYGSKNPGGDPLDYFIPEAGCSAIQDNGEAKILASYWGYIQNKINNAGNGEVINLDRDVKATSGDVSLKVGSGKTVTINLNSHTLDGAGVVDNVFSVDGGYLTIKDDTKVGKVTGAKEAGVHVTLNGNFTLEDGGVISGNSGGGIEVLSGTVTIKKGGSITGNSAENGGGIQISGGTVNIEAGAQIKNNSAANGGGIYIDNSFDGARLVLKGGEITGNSASAEGGGIWHGKLGTTLEVNGAPKVTGNSAITGNNIYLKKNGNAIDNVISVTSLTNDADNPAKLDITASNIDMPLTGSLNDDAKTNAESVFTYNGKDFTESLTIKEDKLYHQEITHFVTVGTWDDLWNALNDTSNIGQTIGLTNDIEYGDSNKGSLLVRFENFNDTITVDLAGHTINRQLSDRGDDSKGHVFDVNKGTLNIIDNTGGGTITGGYDKNGGGIVVNVGCKLNLNGIVITGNKVKGNSPDGDGGAIYAMEGAAISLTDCIISGNTSESGGGGGIFVNKADATLKNVRIENNTAKWGGGGLHNSGESTTSTLVNCTLSGNTAGNEGGGIYNGEGTLNLDNCTITGNTAKGTGGGGICAYGTVTVENGTQIINNKAEGDDDENSRGGGLLLYSTFNMTGGSVSNNTAKDGGGVYIHSGATTLDTVNIENNKTNKYGGAGINNKGSVTLTGCEIKGNDANASGGGMYSSGKSTITGCTFDGNKTKGNGGGIHVCGGTTATVSGCTITNNSSDVVGGGIFDDNNGTLKLTGTNKITGNTANGGKGIYVDGNTEIQGNLQVSDNGGSNVYLNDGKKLTVSGTIETGSQIYVTLKSATGTFTTGYNSNHSGTDPSTFFIPDATGSSVTTDNDGEAMIVDSEWPILQRLIKEAAEGSGSLKLDKNYQANDTDVALTIPAGKSVTIDLNGFTINRNRTSKTDNGQVFIVGAGSSLTIQDTSDNPGIIMGGWAPNGGAVYVAGTGASFTIDSGIIAGNRADNGGAIYMAGGSTVNLNGGLIMGNLADSEAGGIWAGVGTLNASGMPVVTGNTGDGGNNILLDTGNVLHITGALTVGSGNTGGSFNTAALDLAVKSAGEDTPEDGKIMGAKLTIGLGEHLTTGKTIEECAQAVFTYNGQSYEAALQVKNNDLYRQDITADAWISDWAALQDFVSKGENDGKTVGLLKDIDASGDDYSIKVDRDDLNSVTIELNGHKMDRKRSSSKDDGHVIVVKDGAELTIKDSAGTGVITGGNTSDNGGGIKIEKNSTCIIKGGAITGNRSEIDSGFFSDSAGDGGGIWVAGTLIMEGGSVSDNYAEDTGGGIYCKDSGTFTIKNVTVIGNTAHNDGGGMIVHLGNDASIENCRIMNNTSETEDGGAMRVEAKNRTLNITNTEISGNNAENNGGGIIIYAGTVRMSGGSISGNTSEDGAGVYNNDGTIDFTDVSIERNTSTKKGGAGINNRNNASLTDCKIRYNVSNADGGGIYNKDSLTISGGEISYNTTTDDGGGIFNTDTKITVTGTKIIGNSAGKDGGGIFTDEDIEFSGVTLSSNKASISGGGIRVKDCTATLDNCEISENEAEQYGGGIYVNDGSAKLDINGGQINGNVSNMPGGGIYVGDGTDDVYIKGDLKCFDNMGYGDIYLTKDERLEVTGSLSDAYIGIVTEKGLDWSFTKGFIQYNPGVGPEYIFYSNDDYEVYLKDGSEAALRVSTVVDDPNPFIDPDNQMESNMGKINGKNWMSYLPGERSLAQVNMPGTHDSGTKDVEGNANTSIVGKATSGLFGNLFMQIGAIIGGPVGAAAGALLGAYLGDEAFTGASDQFARCQRRFIDEQLEDGIRRFDLRVNTYYVQKETRKDNGKDLWIIHGKSQAVGTYYAKNHEGDWLTLEEVFGWYKEFLKEHPTETIIIEIDAQGIDVDEEVANERIKNHVRELALEINPSTGKPYLYAEDGDYTKPFTRWPKVNECRGQVIYGLGKSTGLTDDKGPDGSFTDPASDKIKNLTNFYTGKKYPENIFQPLSRTADNADINYYISAGTNGTDQPWQTPLGIADEVLPVLFNNTDGLLIDFIGKFIGLVNMDGENSVVSRKVWITNFPQDLEKCIVTVKASDDDNNSKTYTVMKNTTLPIPDCIYDDPNADGNYFQYWMATKKEDGTEIGVFYPEDTFTVTEDVTFTAVWEEVGSSSIRAIWIDGDDADGLRRQRLLVDVTDENNEPHRVTLTADGKVWREDLNYKVKSIEVPGGAINYNLHENYEVDIKGTKIILRHPPTKSVNVAGQIEWHDDDDQAGTRPDSVTLSLYADGEQIKEVTVTATGNWQYDLGDNLGDDETGLPLYKYDADKDTISKINYTLKESPIYGYTTYVSGLVTYGAEEDQGFEIVNSLNSSRSELNGFIFWADEDNKELKRPGKVTVRLKVGDTEIDSKVVTEDSDGHWIFALGLSTDTAYRDQTVSIDEVEGYEAVITRTENAEDGVSITMQMTGHEHQYTEISGITKEPTCEEKGVKTTLRFCSVCGVVNEAGTKNEDIDPLGHDWGKWNVTKTATTTEEGLETRECKRCGKTETRTIPVIDTVTVSVTKVWDDSNNAFNTRPDQVTFNLFADGAKTGTAIANAAGGWKCSFDLLPISANGQKIVYTVTEDSVSNYSMNMVRNETDGNVNYTFTNKYTPLQKHVNVTKVWNDNNDQDGIRPASVEVKLYLTDDDPATEDVYMNQSIHLTEQDGWSGSINVYDVDEFKYKLVEEAIEGYESSVTGDVDTGYTITNTHVPAKKVKIKGEKTWSGGGDKPSSITVRLVADGRDIVYKTVTPDTSGNWTYDFGSHPQYNDGGSGSQIVYTVREDAVTNWNPDYSNYNVDKNGNVTANITNNYTGSTSGDTTSVSCSIEWQDGEDRDGIRPDTTVTLYKTVNGEKTSVTNAVFNKANAASHKWSHTFTDLPVEDESGAAITYTVEETGAGLTGVDGEGTYKVKYSGNQTKGYTITNTHTPLTVVQTQNVIIKWDDGDDADGIRPTDSGMITATLKGTAAGTGKVYEYSGNITEADGWKYGFKNVVTQDANGNEITYELTLAGDSITGNADDGYKYEVSPAVSGVYVVLVSHTPEKVTISGTKTWDDTDNAEGKRPNSITVHLLKVITDTTTDPAKTETKEVDSQTVTASNGWKWSFDVNKNEKGSAITYRVLEDYIPEYVATYTAAEGYGDHNITNQYTAIDPDDQVTVTYNLDGGKYGDSTDNIVEVYNSGTDMTVHAAPDKKNCVFVCWQSNGNNYQPGDTVTVTTGMTFEAVWVAIPLADKRLIVFNANGGTLSDDEGQAQTIVYEYYAEGVRIAIPEAPVRLGYTFLYWQGSTYYPGDSYLVLENHTFTAQWAKNATPPKPSDPEHHSESESDSGVAGAVTPAPTVINPFANYFANMPGMPDTGDSSGKSGSKFAGPDTGDNSHIWLWAILFAASAATVVIAASRGRRRRKSK